MRRLSDKTRLRRLQKAHELLTRQHTELRSQLNFYGTHIDTVRIANNEACIAETAKRLGYILVARLNHETLQLYAVRP